METKRSLAPNFLILLLSLILGLVLAELTLRMGVQWGMIPSWKYQRVLRDGPSDHAKQKILILGDSFLTHWETGYSLYELLIKDLASQGVSLLNTAEGGFGPIDYLTQLKAYGPSYRPDTILLFYYVGNDLTSVQYRSAAWNWFKTYLKPLVTRLHLFYLVAEKREQWFHHQLTYKKVQTQGIDEETFKLAKQRKLNPWLLDLSKEKKEFILDNLLIEKPENIAAWGKIKGVLREIDQFSKKLHSRLILIIIPHTVQINSSHFSFYQKLGFNLDKQTLTTEAPQTLLNEFCIKEEMECLDLLPFFRAQKGKEFFRENDDHFNQEGFELSERLVLEHLRNHGS